MISLTATTTLTSPAGPVEKRLLLPNLLNDFDSLAGLLRERLKSGDWLNAYLLAAGMGQILDDYRHPDPWQLSKVAKNLKRLPRPFGPVAFRVTKVAAGALCRAGWLGTAQLLEWQNNLYRLLGQLAGIIAAELTAEHSNVEAAQALLDGVPGLPSALRQDILRLPSCFRSFDQSPADIAEIVRRFSQGWPERDRPLLVCGVRTSGSYLAPLYAACLRKAGYSRVEWLTHRPGRTLLPQEIARLQALNKAGGLAILTDDPPVTGGSVAAAAQDLQRAGLAAARIVLFLQLFDPKASLPPAPEKYPAVLLPWPQWVVQTRLSPAAVHAALSGLLGPGISIEKVEARPLPPPEWERSHARALFNVWLRDRQNNRAWEQLIYAKGAGLGYFGDFSLAVAERLRDYFPTIYGLREGILYRAWLPEAARLSLKQLETKPELTAKLAAYVKERSLRLAVEEDFSQRLAGQRPVWEVASEILFKAFARPRPVTVPFLRMLHPLTKRLLAVEKPSVIDGSMELANWFVRPEGPNLLQKVDFDSGAFSNHDLYCYDPVYDLACLGASLELDGLTKESFENPAGRLGSAYAALTGEQPSPERRLLYGLVYLGECQRLRKEEAPGWRRAVARLLQQYYAQLFFQDLALPESGPLCALDIDGVLETDQLGGPALSPASAFSLRALARHGYRPVLVSGRSLAEIKERCRAYHLAAGVAEYGSITYNHLTGKVTCLLSETQRAELDRLRAVLARTPGVRLDPDYRYAVRAYRPTNGGGRRGLSPALVRSALAEAACRCRVRPIPGDSQTDFMVEGVDKGSGLQALARELSAGAAAEEVRLAAGDTFSDLPMLKLADIAFAPGHAAWVMGKVGVEVMSRSYQAGLAQGVARLLGHRPGSCPVCQVSSFGPDTERLLKVLGALDQTLPGKLRLAFSLRRLAR